MMLKESITIRNFGPIREVHIDEIHPFTILIGESASGKSTILKVVALFRYIYKMLNIRFYLKNANIDKSPFRIRLKDYFKANSLDEYVKPNSEIAYTVTVNGNKYELIYANGKLKNPKAMQDEDLVYFKGSFISENRNIIPTWAAKASNNRGASLGFYFHETYHDFDDATNLIDEIKLNYLNLKFQVRKVNGKKKFTVSDSGKTYSPVDLRAASSGVQTSVPLLAITRYYAHDFDFKQALRRSVLSYLYDTDRLLKFQPQVELNKLARYVHLHVEEPELSLYPDAQINLIEELVKQLFFQNDSEAEMGMMLATHSPYIVNFANLLLLRSKSNELNNQVRLSANQLAVYKVHDGTIQNLMCRDANGNLTIDALPLSEPMAAIYDQYATLYQLINNP